MGEPRVVDNRGLKCPLPVINTKRALSESAEMPLISIVDNETARDNVRTFAEIAGYHVDVERKSENEFHVIISGKVSADGEKRTEAQRLQEADLAGGVAEPLPRQVYLIGTNRLGSGDPELGELLMKSFIYALSEQETAPKALIFLNSGVYLTTEGSPVLESLDVLARKGCRLLSCGTCLDFYGLKDELRVGRVTNMYEIVDALSGPGKVIVI